MFRDVILTDDIDGEALSRLEDDDLDEDFKINKLGAQQKIVGWRDDLLEAEKEYNCSHEDPLENPLNWKDILFNSMDETELSPPVHDLIRNPLTGEHD
eukprot:UN29905